MKPLKFLIVDDDAEPRNMLEKMLTAFGHQVIGKESNYAGAIRAALDESRKPDMILMDILLDEEQKTPDGVDAAKAIWDVCDMPIIFISHYPDEYKDKVNKEYALLLRKKDILRDKTILENHIVSYWNIIEKIRMKNNVIKTLANTDSFDVVTTGELPEYFIITKDRDTEIIVKISDVFYIEKEGSWTKFYMIDGTCKPVINIINNKSLEARSNGKLRQIHDKYLINMDFFESIDRKNNAVYLRCASQAKTLSVGRTFQDFAWLDFGVIQTNRKKG